MQILPFLLAQLPQFVLNLTSPTQSLSSEPPQVTGTVDMAKYTLPALPYAYDVSFFSSLGVFSALCVREMERETTAMSFV